MSTLLPVFAMLFNALVWGLAWWPFRIAHDSGLHPLWTTALLYALALVGLSLWRPGLLRQTWNTPRMWQLALAAGLTNVCFNWAVTVGDVVRVVLLFYLMPAWSVLLGWKLLGERPTPMAWVRLAMALAGVVCVVLPPGREVMSDTLSFSLADGLAIAGGALFALTNVFLRGLRDAAPERRMAAMFSGAAFMAAAVAAATFGAGMVPGWPAWHPAWGMATLGLVVIFTVGNLALQYGAARLPVATSALLMLSEVVFASVSAVWLGAAQWQTGTTLGAMLILGAALLSIPRRAHAAGGRSGA